MLIEKLLVVSKREFGGEDNKSAKVAKLKQVEQGSWTKDKFVQIFKWAVRGNRYKEQALVEEFKREINNIIRYKLIKME